MIKYDIAGLCIQFDGDTNDYFNNRLAEYVCVDQNSNADIIVKCEFCNDIVPPKGNVVANINQRIWVETEDGYASYDYNTDLNLCLAKIIVDKQWKHIDVQLYNLEKLSGFGNTYSIYNMLGEVFRFAILKHDGIVIHSSSIDYNGNGVIFSAPSETGKSTHTGLWIKYFPDKTVVLNDDSPAIRYIQGVPYVFGTPWSGSSEINCNRSAPFKAVVFLKQSKMNHVNKLDTKQAVPLLMNEIRQPAVGDMMLLSLHMMDKLFKDVPVYLLECNISKDAVELVKNKIGI